MRTSASSPDWSPSILERKYPTLLGDCSSSYVPFVSQFNSPIPSDGLWNVTIWDAMNTSLTSSELYSLLMITAGSPSIIVTRATFTLTFDYRHSRPLISNNQCSSPTGSYEGASAPSTVRSILRIRSERVYLGGSHHRDFIIPYHR